MRMLASGYRNKPSFYFYFSLFVSFSMCQTEHWSSFLQPKKKKKNSRSKSMFELADNPYSDDHYSCCNTNTHHHHHHHNETATLSTKRSSSLIYSLLLSNASTLQCSNTTTASLFLLKFSRTLISCGTPSHRLDYCLQQLMQKLDLKAQFGYFPGFLVVSFGELGN